jgi:hypothetical protein
VGPATLAIARLGHPGTGSIEAAAAVLVVVVATAYWILRG